jgi:putative membrane-bound dehydrogenase-like protein
MKARKRFRWQVSVATISALLAVGRMSAAEFTINGLRFTVPEGFTVELAAGTNLVPRPVSASFDDQGRLYVTDSSGSNDAPKKQLENPTHRILRLTDSDGDGRFDQAVVFAEKVMFPQGCLWHDGSVYVAGPPSIWKFTDTDGDGVADKREEWFKGGTLTGCANDIHGPYLGPDGYIYWTKGAFAEQTHTLGNGRVLKDRAAHIYRARPDGSDLDVIMSGGMDNPVDVAFTAEGEPVFTSTFIDFSQPGFRDGIGYAVYGSVFGKVNDVLEDGAVKRTGPDLFHPFFQAGPAAECGLCRYQGSAFGPEYHNHLFATTFNLRKVTRHVLRANGAGYASTDSDFLVCDSQDFHPTDVFEDADGSLLVIDTGGWYKLCCPSSQLNKPEVLGGIYRVRKEGTPRVALKDRHAAYQAITWPPAMSGSAALVALKRAVWENNPTNAPRFRAVLARASENSAADRKSVV